MVGLNERSNIVMIAISPFFYMLIGTMAAAQNNEPVYLKVAELQDQHARSVPAGGAAGGHAIIISSLRLSLGGALLITIGVEALAAKSGIGFMI